MRLWALIILTLFLIGCQTEAPTPVVVDEEHDEDIGEMDDKMEDLDEEEEIDDLDEVEDIELDEEADMDESMDDEDSEETMEETMEVQEFNVVASNWAFTPDTINVQKDVPVKLIIESTGNAHGIAIPEFGVSASLPTGETTEVEFTPDKVGEFDLFCNVFCGSGHGAMRGTLVVS